MNIDFSSSTEKVISQIKYYHPKVTSETRFIRHRDKLLWPPDITYPVHKGVISPKKIRLKHYQYRSPQQIQTRIEIRKKAIANGHKYFRKDNVDNWEDLILSQSELISESKEMKIGWVKDPNEIPWYYYGYLYVMHNLKIYP
jgi:hypothetical protein